MAVSNRPKKTSVFAMFIFDYNSPVCFSLITSQLPAPVTMVPRVLLVVLSLILLCHCAVKHQPTVFEPHYYFKPKKSFSAKLYWEKQKLQKQESHSLLEKRKLLELNQKEMRELEAGSTYYEKVREEGKKLKEDLSDMLDELKDIRETVRDRQRSKIKKSYHKQKIDFPPLRKAYQVAYEFWNKDENESALEAVGVMLNEPSFRDEASDEEWLKIVNLKFRICLDVGKFEEAEKLYQDLKRLGKCNRRTATAAFLISLLQFSGGRSDQALVTLFEQCHEESSLSRDLRNSYWACRFDKSKQGKAVCDVILKRRVPDYYVYLVASQTKQKIKFSKNMRFGRSYLTTEWEVPRKVHYLLTSAENRLRGGLYRDAETFLLLASSILRDDPDDEQVPALLYTAHLLQASGSHLEAMRIYSVVTKKIQANPLLSFDFVDEMFPQPFRPQVEAISQQWKVDPDLVYSLMRQESAFNPEANSPADARGLMQLMPFLALSLADEWEDEYFYRHRHLFHGEENLKWSIYHLHQLGGRIPHIALIAAAYNAGVERMSGWWKRYGHFPLDVFVELIPVAETRNYVKKILRNYLYYKVKRSGGVAEYDLFPLELPPYQLSTAP